MRRWSRIRLAGDQPDRSGRTIGDMGPRIFGIPASNAATVAVIRRGPSGWCQVGRWEPELGTYTAGSWLHGTIYPQRCDLSPDGRWLLFFTLKGNARWDVGATYIAISRLPWLTALAAWGTCGTWTRGLHFADRQTWEVDDPAVGDLAPLRRRYGLAITRAATFAVERRRGWNESADTPVRAPDDHWDEQRAARVTMEKPRPEDPDTRLSVSGRYAAFRDMGPAWGHARYALIVGVDTRPLDGVQWADWAQTGRLLVATGDGALEVREAPFGPGSATWSTDLAVLTPEPVEPPAEAHRW